MDSTRGGESKTDNACCQNCSMSAHFLRKKRCSLLLLTVKQAMYFTFLNCPLRNRRNDVIKGRGDILQSPWALRSSGF
jgi:hypothetical protein